MRSRLMPTALAVAALLTPLFLVSCESTGSEAAAVQEGAVRAGMPTMAARDTQEEFGPYMRPTAWPNWFANHEGWTFPSSGAIYAESPDRIWVAARGEVGVDGGPNEGERRWHHVIYAVNSDGQVVEEWPQHDAMFSPVGVRGPHKIKMNPYDPEKHIWVIDDQLHQIFRFTYDGQLDHTLGTQLTPGRGPNNFARPTDIAFLPDGTYFISDGYDGTRVAKFDPNDNFVMDWGQEPADPDNPGPNEFNTVHSIAISSDRMIYVVARAHARIQDFDENGNFQFMFSTGEMDRSRPYAHEIMMDPQTGQEYIWVADGGTHRILKFDLEGNFLYTWGIAGDGIGQFAGPHSLSTDQDGNLYTAEVFNNRLQQWIPRPGADPAKLAGQLLRQYTPTID